MGEDAEIAPVMPPVGLDDPGAPCAGRYGTAENHRYVRRGGACPLPKTGDRKGRPYCPLIRLAFARHLPPGEGFWARRRGRALTGPETPVNGPPGCAAPTTLMEVGQGLCPCRPTAACTPGAAPRSRDRPGSACASTLPGCGRIPAPIYPTDGSTPTARKQKWSFSPSYHHLIFLT